jgi:Ni,Fe-hydrogenase III large subunit
LARTLLDALREDEVAVSSSRSALTAAGAEGEASVEGPHGPVHAEVALGDDEHVTHLRVSTPGASALIAALPELLQRQSLALTPLILASLDVCVECADG